MGAAERSAPAGRSDRGLIELSVDAPMDLFNALDPSPLLERDLDEEVETYIVESAHELPHREYHLKIHICARRPSPDEAAALVQAIRTYFRYRHDIQARRLRLLMQEGRRSLAVGFAFLFLCWGLGMLAMSWLPSPIDGFLNEGVLIIGWVALWRPAEIFLYDWRPMRQQRAILEALTRMTIDIGSPPEAAEPEPTEHPLRYIP
jgi:hypothetical protein